MSRLKKELGIGQGVGLLATSLLGTGIFVVPAVAASIAGQWSLLAWIILIALVLPVAFTFALLGRRFPHAGGTAHIVGQAMGKRLEKLTAFLFLSVLPVGIPAALIMATGFWHSLFTLTPLAVLAIKLGTLITILLVGLGGAKLSGNVQGIIALLIVFLVASLWLGGDIRSKDMSLPVSEWASATSVVPALAVMFWCFVGIEAFTHMGEEFKNPKRDFPIALLLGVILAGLVYWGCSVVILKYGIYGVEAENTRAIPSLVAQLFGPTAQWLAVIVGYLACFASMNIYIQGFARLLWSMADEGYLNRIGLQPLGKLNQHQVPVRALWCVVIIAAFSALGAHLLKLPLDVLIRYANGNFILIYLFCMLAGVWLLSNWKKWLAAISACLCIGVLITLGTDMNYAIGLGIIFLGITFLTPGKQSSGANPV